MDRLGVELLRAELASDCAVLRETASAAQERWTLNTREGTEACAYQLARLSNVGEQFATRVARAFENQVEDTDGWQAGLIRRLSLHIPGVRPPLFTPSTGTALKELRAFRHMIRHADDVELDRDRMEPIVRAAVVVAAALDRECEEFLAAVAAEQGWDGPPPAGT